MNWKFSYAIGFHPWEDTDQEFFQSLSSLLEHEEQGREPPHGRALDIGTGSAIWGIELAKRGWEVTGVDFVEKALDRGRERVQAAGVEMKLVQGDVTRLSEAEVGSGFRLILDTGTFHDFDTEQQLGMARSVDALGHRGRYSDLALLAAAHSPVDPGREPRRNRGRLCRLADHRRETVLLQAAATPGMGAAPGRALVPPAPCMSLTRRLTTGCSGQSATRPSAEPER